MEKTVKFYFSAFRTYFEYQLPFDTEQYDKFKALCVACAEDTNFASLGLLAERCEEFEEDDAWFTSDDAMDLETDIFQFVVNKAVNLCNIIFCKSLRVLCFLSGHNSFNSLKTTRQKFI